jgi:hypothetical protein
LTRTRIGDGNGAIAGAAAGNIVMGNIVMGMAGAVVGGRVEASVEMVEWGESGCLCKDEEDSRVKKYEKLHLDGRKPAEGEKTDE